MLPRPPPAIAQSPAAPARPVPPQRSLLRSDGSPKPVAERAQEEEAIRASIARAKRKLAAKKKLQAARALGRR